MYFQVIQSCIILVLVGHSLLTMTDKSVFSCFFYFCHIIGSVRVINICIFNLYSYISIANFTNDELVLNFLKCVTQLYILLGLHQKVLKLLFLYHALNTRLKCLDILNFRIIASMPTYVIFNASNLGLDNCLYDHIVSLVKQCS